jgi:HEAT repeat protein
VVPITPDLISYTEQGDVANRTVAIAVLGVIAKEYPNIAKETVPTAIELLDAENHMLQTNAAGLLADLSEEYPTVTRPCVPRAIELLENDNKKVRYNATSILSRIAKVHPEDVEPAIPALIEALEDEHDYSRVNASWALGYLEANEALDILKERSQDDTNEEVRYAANKAIQMIVEDSC